MIFDEQAEKALLGALIQHENPSGYLLALSEDDMVFEDDKIILTAMHRLMARREPFDMGVVTTEAAKDSRYTANTTAMTASITAPETLPIAENALCAIEETLSPTIVNAFSTKPAQSSCSRSTPLIRFGLAFKKSRTNFSRFTTKA